MAEMKEILLSMNYYDGMCSYMVEIEISDSNISVMLVLL